MVAFLLTLLYQQALLLNDQNILYSKLSPSLFYKINSLHCIRYQINKNGSEIAIIGLGSFYQLAEEVAKLIEEKKHIHPTLINPLFINKIDEETLNVLKKQHRIVITLEDGIVSGGFGSRISQFYGDSCVKVLNFGFSMNLPTVFDPNEVMIKNGLTPELIVKRIFDVI